MTEPPSPHDPHHPYVRKLIGCGHGRLFSEPCRDCEIVKLHTEYRDAIKTVARGRNELRRLGAPLPGFTSQGMKHEKPQPTTHPFFHTDFDRRRTGHAGHHAGGCAGAAVMHLPFDYARCEGAGKPPCNDCLRRLSPGHPEYQWYTLPPGFDGGKCPLQIPEIKEYPND